MVWKGRKGTRLIAPVMAARPSSNPWKLCSKSLGLYSARWCVCACVCVVVKQNCWYLGGIYFQMSFFRIYSSFGSSGRCWDHHPSIISSFSLHCYWSVEIEMSLFSSNYVILDICDAASDEISWKDNYFADFENRVPICLVQVPDAQTELHWLVWMIWCQDSSSVNGQQGAYPMTCLLAVQQFQIFRNMFRKPDISSWDTMPESWSSDNLFKKVAARVD